MENVDYNQNSKIFLFLRHQPLYIESLFQIFIIANWIQKFLSKSEETLN